ncbi:glycoside hydrolase family 68 protein [Sphingomonas nostoxanthinifaciens]|uniref:glycoside hydrolase family 68 protein n=1 Tax=Sphingomonas nostoxanthinifaciens TaxID=2872652 RepID=UPI001CC216FE|nr:glycoside hydrolase family 68 protein [Sphingomonas nostoxanthinifaciens]UAK23151.1 glycoside hydrolase family 68 protein [Sphingomonas nostoxanthinifaciens]
MDERAYSAAEAPPSAWTAEHVAGADAQTGAAIPVIRAADVQPMLADGVVWDMWPIQWPDASTVVIDGRSFWFFLAAPRADDPDLRHDRARIRLFSWGADGWRDHGDTFQDGFTPGSREWSGTAVLDEDGHSLTHYFTAAGRHGQPRTFEQRLFETRGHFEVEDGVPRLSDWTTPIESVAADGIVYAHADQAQAEGGLIKGFRDPGYFRDPADGTDYLLFAGTAAASEQRYDGVVGIARREGAQWAMLPPLVTAIGLNAELERPHIVTTDGRYYLFWSTQRARFAPAGPSGPNGLYGMVAEQLSGPWRPLNGTGLVAANPREEPLQAYCWWVTGEFDVISFVDLWGLDGRDPTVMPELRARQFGGTVAPWFSLHVAGDHVVPRFGPR